MDRSELLSVITPVSRPELLPRIAPTVPRGAEWLLVTDGPVDLPGGLRDHVAIEGPATGRFGDVQRQIGLERASRPYVAFLDDDNVMLPALPDLVLGILEATGAPGVLFGLLLRHPAGFYAWPPPVRVERSSVDTAMVVARTALAREVGWPDLRSGAWPGLEDARCGDFLFLRALDEAHPLLRLPAVYGFHDGLAVLRHDLPDLHAALERGEEIGPALLDVLHRHLRHADAPPWWKAQDALAGAGGLVPRLEALARDATEGSSVPAQREHFQRLALQLAAERPGQPVEVLEIGFNAGVGAAALLEASPQVHVVSLDLGEHAHVAACARLLRDHRPDRFHLVVGDSRVTLPRVGRATGARFDLVVVDGGHDAETCRTDVLHARAVAAPGARVVVDDLMPHKAYGVGVVEAWEALLAEGVLVEPRIFGARPGAAHAEEDAGDPPGVWERRWGVARFASD